MRLESRWGARARRVVLALLACWALVASLAPGGRAAGHPVPPLGRPGDPAAVPQLAALAEPSTPLSADYTPGQVVVALAPHAPADLAARLAAERGLAVLDRLPALGAVVLGVPAGEEQAWAERLAGEPGVRWAEPNRLRTAALVPNDTYYEPFQWNLRKIGLETAWEVTTGSPEVVVAVLDTGVDLQHPDLAPNLTAGYDFLNDDPVPQDDSSHGTHVAGIIAAIGNNGQGVSGVAWRTKVMPIKVLSARGRGPDAVLARGLIYAADNGARIINVSSVGADASALLADAVAYAAERGALVVAAAGNSGDRGNEVVYPAAYPGVLAVGATDPEDRPAPFSQRHDYVGLAAPGVGIPSTAWPGAGVGSYALASGTSAAAPHVSGVAALLLALDPRLSADDLRRILQATADHDRRPEPDNALGAGRVNAARAVAAVRPTPVVTPGPTPQPGATPQPLPSLAPLATAPLPRAPSAWYFAEGSTRPPFETWLALLNPNEAAVPVRLTFETGDGRTLQQELLVPALSRRSVFLNQVVPDAEVSVAVEAPATVFAERSVFFGHDGHTSTGVSAPSTTWYLAEGSTALPFETWVLLQNPGAAPATARLTFQKEDGTTQELVQVVPPRARRSVFVNLLFRNVGFATTVTSDQPIVVERAMYFDRGGGGHGSVAVKAPARTWYFAEGDTRAGRDTWLLVQNPQPAPAQVRITLFREDGPPLESSQAVRPNGRLALLLNQLLPESRFGLRVEADQPVVAERSVYLEGGLGGHSSAGALVPAGEWYLAEGSTLPPFAEEILLLNPNPAPARVEITLYPAQGEPIVAQTLVGAASRATIDVGQIAPDVEGGARIVADRPIVVERTVTFAEGRGATNALGVPR